MSSSCDAPSEKEEERNKVGGKHDVLGDSDEGERKRGGEK